MQTSDRLLAFGAAALVALAACGGSDGGTLTEAGPDSIAANADDLDLGLDPTPPTAAAGSTTTHVPSSAADLPTGPPPGATVDATDSASVGPLPEPSLQLLEVGQFDRPTGMATRPLDSRLFVLEQAGRVLAVDDLSEAVVLDITDRVTSGGEQGLLGLAFHPATDLAYVHFSGDDGQTVIAEFAVDPFTAEFDADSYREVLTVDQPFSNHNGGQLAFGDDQLLYIGLGDGGSADDPLRAALDLSTPLGKILRIDPQVSGDEPFTVPPGNPFVDVDGADPTIWSYGLRNPWRFAFDEQTGDLWIADVGQNEIEEVNLATADGAPTGGRGVSFGWSAFEGDQPFNADQDPDGHLDPRFTYRHEGGRCSISGGALYRGDLVSNLDGWYLYGDYCSGELFAFDPTSPTDAPRTIDIGSLPEVVAIASGPDEQLFAISNAGTLVRIDSV
ncbi:MAG: PQQ-dependent sugar dehydrogenase [Actinomycetota bacterium]